MRIAIGLKKDQFPEVIINQLYKHTQLENSFGIIFLAVVNNRPEILNLKEILEYFILHRKDIIIRRTRYELKKAEELGMTNTHFVDPTGLSDYNRSTAVDIMILTKATLANEEIYSATSKGEYNIDIINKGISRRIISTDKILNKDFGLEGDVYSVAAGKTGYLKRAGYCFASLVTNQRGREILTVVLGSSTINDRFVDTKSLAYWVFNNYVWK